MGSTRRRLSQRSLASTGGREARLTSSRLLTRTATAPFPLTSGSALPTRTTRAKLCQLPLTRPTRTPSLPTAKRWETLLLRATRRSTGSAGSASRLRTLTAISTANQKRLGLPAPFQTQEERDACFKAMDENGDGAISYDEWLSFFLKDIISPVAAL